jgi:tetratricopeptide (TPR) repeat protein
MKHGGVFLLAGLSAMCLSAQPKWIRMENENFHVFSSAGERQTKTVIDNLERVRDFFVEMSGAAPPRPVPISVVVFGSEKEYQPFRLNESAIAYYAGRSDRDFIVIGKLGEQSAQIANHEYTHLVFQHAGYNLPPWLNEGVAELFGTLKSIGSSFEFGDIIPGRLLELRSSPWIPLATLFAVDHASPYYNESKRAGNFYSESWALAHMLATSREYGAKFWPLVDAIRGGTESGAALQQVYGVPVSKIEEDLKYYVRDNRFNKLAGKLKLQGAGNLTAQPADPFDVSALEADLLMQLPGKQADAKARFESLASENDQRPEPWASLGYLAWRDGKPQAAIPHFAKAFDRGNRSPRMLWDYALLALSQDPTASARALTALLEIEPTNANARLELANLYLGQRDYPAALKMVRSVTNVRTAEQRDRALYIRAFSAMQTGDRADALARAQELQRLTRNPRWSDRADELLRYLAQIASPTPVAPRPPTRVEVVESEPPSSLEDRIERDGAVQRGDDDKIIILQDATGTLVEVVCQAPTRMILETPQGRKTFVVLDPDRMIITGRVGRPEFKCGVQTPAQPLRLQFSDAPNGSNLDGVVRLLHFAP